MVDLVSLGEMMLRLSPPKYQRLRRTASLDVYPAGAQFNIAANLASLGKRTAFLTKLPTNELGLLAQSLAASYGIDTSHIRYVDDAKMALVFVEFSVSPRRHLHLYDRAGSAASTLTKDDFPWSEILSQARLAYVDGIVPALNSGCREATLAFVEAAKAAGCTVCFDVNYRQTLWEADEARSAYQEILPGVDILVTGRTVSEDLFGYTGSDDDLLRAYHEAFGCEIVCLTYRETHGILRGGWRSVALREGQVTQGRPFEFDVVDRFGSGDAFFAGFLYVYLEKGDVQQALDFGNALCALAHTVEADPAIFSPEEVQALLDDDYSLTTKR
jgi:2-dehydro-3-deoxygluconokinase